LPWVFLQKTCMLEFSSHICKLCEIAQSPTEDSTFDRFMIIN
jgi:hypothetical protein